MSYTDAFFEAMSGLTTTGATVITNLDSAPPGILLWRALLQWFGGIGIIVMAISVLPMLNIGGMQLFRLESSDTSEKILPRTAQIAGSIMRLYFGITLACVLCYLAAGMNMFDAVAHAMTTIATGGFSTRNDSFGAFGAPVAMVAIFFMLVSAVPFVAYLQLVNRKFDKFVRDEQIRTFFLLALIAAATMWIYQLSMFDQAAAPALLSAAFNTTSILTGTGYATTDYGAWGPFAVALFFILTFIGGCAGSTACGLKIFRMQVIVKAGWRYIRQLTRPNGVFVIRYNGRLLDDDVANSVVAFVLIFILSFSAIAVALSLMAGPADRFIGFGRCHCQCRARIGPRNRPVRHLCRIADTSQMGARIRHAAWAIGVFDRIGFIRAQLLASLTVDSLSALGARQSV